MGRLVGRRVGRPALYVVKQTPNQLPMQGLRQNYIGYHATNGVPRGLAFTPGRQRVGSGERRGTAGYWMGAGVVPARLVCVKDACYCPAGLEEGIPPQPVPEPAAPLPLPPLPPQLGYMLPIEPAPYLGYYGYGTAWARKPRVWTVFVAFVVALVAGLGMGTVIPILVVAAQHHGTFSSPDELINTLRGPAKGVGDRKDVLSYPRDIR